MKLEARLSNVRRFHARSGRLIEVNNTKWKWACGLGLKPAIVIRKTGGYKYRNGTRTVEEFKKIFGTHE